MKKEYVAPRINVIEIESTAILASSETDTTPQIDVNDELASEEDEVL